MGESRPNSSRARRWTWFLFPLLAVAIAALVVARLRSRRPLALRTPPAASATPVLLITVDTVRADHVGCYGYSKVETPAMDFLAAQGVRFDNALVQVPITLPSHIVILTGTYPMWNGVRDFSRPWLQTKVGWLAEAFQRHGYTTAAFISAFPLDASFGFNHGFATYDEAFEQHAPGESPVERRAGETIDHTLAWFQAHDPRAQGAQPFFVWVHLYDPHAPYDPPEPFHSRYAAHLYDGEIAYADSELGRLFDYLRRIGLYDRTLIMLLSDHGESLGEHGEDFHGYYVYRSTVRVPWIVKPQAGPHNAVGARVIRSAVGTIDVAPTLLDLAGLQDPLARQFQGSSLAALISGKAAESERPVYSESYTSFYSFGWSPLRSLSTDRFQYIAAPRPELYDLTQDPAEEHNINARREADTLALHDQLLDVERRYTNRTSPASEGDSLSAEAVEKLKSLGYVAYSAPTSEAGEAGLPDPKDRIATYVAIGRAENLAGAGQFASADAVLKSLLPKEPKLYLIPCMLGLNYQKEGRLPDAERELRACLKLDSTFELAMAALAQVATDEGKPDEARAWLELDIAHYPQNYLPYAHLGALARSGFDLAEAQRDFEKAVALKPDLAAAQKDLGMILMEEHQPKDAIPPLERAAALGLNDAKALDALGSAYMDTNHPHKAIEAYQKALDANRDFAPARLNLALAYLKAGEQTRARDEFRTACAQGGPQCQQYEKLFQ